MRPGIQGYPISSCPGVRLWTVQLKRDGAPQDSPGEPISPSLPNVWGQQQAQGPRRKPCRVCIQKASSGLRESAPGPAQASS